MFRKRTALLRELRLEIAFGVPVEEGFKAVTLSTVEPPGKTDAIVSHGSS